MSLDAKRPLLHVGCGGEPMPDYLKGMFDRVRLDIDPDCAPDLCADITALPIASEAFAAIYCSHTLEHVYPYQVLDALKEFRRVLRSGGCAIIFVPDLEGVQADNEVLCTTPAGDITGLDMYYGYAPYLKDRPAMVHKTGFIARTLEQALVDAGFSRVIMQRCVNYNLLGAAVK